MSSVTRAKLSRPALPAVAEAEVEDGDSDVAQEDIVVIDSQPSTSGAAKAPPADLRTAAERRQVLIANVLLNLCGVVLWAGMLTINALYDGIISTTGWELSQVSLLFTLQVFTCFLFCPLWGIAASYVSIRKLLALAVFIGAILNLSTGLVYLTNSYGAFCVLQILKGIFLAPCQVLNRALIPKYYPLAERGKYYGLLEVSAGVGGLLGVIFGMASYVGGAEGYYGCDGDASSEASSGDATLLCPGDPGYSNATLLSDGCDGGIPKWSLPFFVLGAFMLPCSFLILKFVIDPNKDETLRQRLGEERLKVVFPGLRDEDTRLSWTIVKSMFSIKTWVFIVLQGMTGAFPWPAMSLLLYWFQLLGINDFLAILVSAGPAIGAAIGGGIGGCIGDRLYRTWSKRYGRTAASHFSIAVGPFLFIVMFFAIPQDSDSWWIFGLYGAFAGSLISWSAPNNNAILSDVFPEATFPLAYGVAQLAEGSVSAWAPFAVAIIAENIFGVGGLQDFECKSEQEKADDANGLALAIFSVICVGWGSCTLVVFGFYRYYPRESLALNPSLGSPGRRPALPGSPVRTAPAERPSVVELLRVSSDDSLEDLGMNI